MKLRADEMMGRVRLRVMTDGENARMGGGKVGGKVWMKEEMGMEWQVTGGEPTSRLWAARGRSES